MISWMEHPFTVHYKASAPLDLEAALARVLGEVSTVAGTETVPLGEALGRVAAKPVRSPTDLPPFPASAMDGYAFRWRPHIGSLRVIGESFAGHPFAGSVGQGECVRIMTGAPLPPDCDTVILQEDCDRNGTEVRTREATAQGDNVRAVGDDLRSGDVVAAAGKRLSPFDIGILAACGCATASVRARPRVAVFSTGDELQPPGTTLEFGNIYDSNRFAVTALLSRMPVEVANLGVLADDAEAVAASLAGASAHSALILTSGGVSVGDADHVRNTVEKLGRLSFWRLHLKPGKPLAFGRIGNALFIGLPGNPVSTIVTYLLVARPAIEKLCGMQRTERVTATALLTEPIRHKPGREEYQRGIATGSRGHIHVRATGAQGSNRMSTFANANCLIRIPGDRGSLNSGEPVEVLLFEGLLS